MVVGEVVKVVVVGICYRGCRDAIFCVFAVQLPEPGLSGFWDLLDLNFWG
jgi:hypothetical protein